MRVVRGVNRFREIFLQSNFLTFTSPEHLWAEVQSGQRWLSCPWKYQLAQRFIMQKPYEHLRLRVVIWAWLKFSIHFTNLNYSWKRSKNQRFGPLRGCLEIMASRLLEDRFMCFHHMPHFSCAVPWPAHFLRSFWFRIQIVHSPPRHSPADSDMLFERVPGNANPPGISMRGACLENSSSKFCTSASIQMHLFMCIKTHFFSGEEFLQVFCSSVWGAPCSETGRMKS